MEKNSSSDSHVCRKIREALATCPALRAIHQISQRHQESKTVTIDSNSPSSPPTKVAKTTTASQTKPTLPQHLKVNTKEAGAVPITFDYSTPISNGNGNSTVSAKFEHDPSVFMQGKPPTKVGFSANAGTGQGVGYGSKAASEGEEKGKPIMAESARALVETGPQGKKDINHASAEYIQHAGIKIRTVSNVGKGENNPAPDEANGGTKKKDNHREHFSNFIHLARKKIRTTSIIRKD